MAGVRQAVDLGISCIILLSPSSVNSRNFLLAGETYVAFYLNHVNIAGYSLLITVVDSIFTVADSNENSG
jgi:hypothetical protein